jgi:hypothetical protein
LCGGSDSVRHPISHFPTLCQVDAWSDGEFNAFAASWPHNGFDVKVLSGGTDHIAVPLLEARTPKHTHAHTLKSAEKRKTLDVWRSHTPLFSAIHSLL